VFEFTNRAGADSVVLQACSNYAQSQYGVASYTTDWLEQSGLARVVIEFDDGTLATIDGSLPFNTSGKVGFADSSNPDEYGLIFQVPFDCKVDGFYFSGAVMSTATAEYDWSLYSDPLGTPTSMVSGTGYGERNRSSVNAFQTLISFAEQTLAKNTDYWLAMKATNIANVGYDYYDLADAAYRALISGSTNMRQGTRNNSSGAASETTTRIPAIKMRVCSVDDGTGTGSGGGFAKLVGPGGLVA
jgi:hypothetical protein